MTVNFMVFIPSLKPVFKKTSSLLMVVALSFSLLLTACGKQNLYTNVPENQADEMIAVLAQHHIQASKSIGTVENSWNVQVTQDQFARAVTVLKSQGLPRDQFTNLSESFKKSGLVSSPEEERIRFMSALSQQIAETLTHIDGVVTARVIINIPNNDPMAEKIQPSSASVFILYKPNADIQSDAFQIKTLVANSVSGLSFDKVSLAMFPASLPPAPSPANGKGDQMKSVMSMQVPHQSVTRLQTLLTIAGLLIALCLAGLIYFFLRYRRLAGTRIPESAHGSHHTLSVGGGGGVRSRSPATGGRPSGGTTPRSGQSPQTGMPRPSGMASAQGGAPSSGTPARTLPTGGVTPPPANQ